jgi:hypothetical protein
MTVRHRDVDPLGLAIGQVGEERGRRVGGDGVGPGKDEGGRDPVSNGSGPVNTTYVRGYTRCQRRPLS